MKGIYKRFEIVAICVTLAWSVGAHAQDDTDTKGGSYDSNRILGIGLQRLPAWPGAENSRNVVVPFVHLELPWHITLSTYDGATVDFIHSDGWHGGLYANFTWGRDRSELHPPPLDAMDSFSSRINAGGYIEHDFTSWLSVGTDLSHDIGGSGAYWRVYSTVGLPSIWYYMHEFELQWQGTNGAAMRRNFGVTPVQAQALGVDPWQPGAGSQEAVIQYSAFMPTSLHTGFALSINYARLIGSAGDSPLVRKYGSPNQLTSTLAFVYRFL
ncbi:MipA/OmpV family protein [Dyella solisilvae]|uniref:MipA/OmpV family protein n=1 Tax=Dyella solisilvae TaxID=1920168 RepID=UPI0013140EA6|nr:MipA/OmpV family protein [Dyella solisilvae]